MHWGPFLECPETLYFWAHFRVTKFSLYLQVCSVFQDRVKYIALSGSWVRLSYITFNISLTIDYMFSIFVCRH